MKAKKLVSLFAALTMLTSLHSVALARTTTETTTVYSLDLSGYEAGQVLTPEELKEDLGLSLIIPSESKDQGFTLPVVTVREEEIKQNNQTSTKKYLEFKIAPKSSWFQLAANFSYPENVTEPDKIHISVLHNLKTNYNDDTRKKLYKNIDKSVWSVGGAPGGATYAYKTGYLPEFDDFAQLSIPGKIIVQTRMKPNADNPTNAGYLSYETPAGLSPRYGAYQTWLNQNYVLNYNGTNVSFETYNTTPWKAVEDKGTATINTTQLPNNLAYKINKYSLNALANEIDAALCISEINVTAEKEVTHNEVATTNSTFVDGVTADSAATRPAVFGNNVYQVNPITNSWPTAKALNKTEIPKTADQVRYQFCDVDAADGDAKLIVARYDLTEDGYKEIKDATITDVTVADGKVVTDAVDLRTLTDGMLMQVYLWSADGNLVPLAKYGSAEIGATGTAIYKHDFETNYEVVDNQMGRFAATDNCSSTVSLTNEEARFGDKSIKVTCKAESKIAGTGLNRNGFRFETKERDGYSRLGEELRNVALNTSDVKDLYRISFYAKADTAPATLRGEAQCYGLVQGEDANWNENWNDYYWKRYLLFNNVTIQPGDWQYCVVYTTFPMFNWSPDWNTTKLLTHDIFRYDTLNMDVSTAVDQNVYFDELTIEKVN